MKRLALALLSFVLPLSAQKTIVEIPENMVRTEPITENLANMKLSFGASPGPVVRPTEVKNDFLLSYKGVGIGDEVTIDKKKTGRVAELLQRHLVRVDMGGNSKNVDAARCVVKTPAEAIDLRDKLEDAQAKANAPPDPMFAELPPDVLASLPPSVLKFEAPSAEALVALPRAEDVVKICDGDERFWTLVTAVDGDVVDGIVINKLIGGQASVAVRKSN